MGAANTVRYCGCEEINVMFRANGLLMDEDSYSFTICSHEQWIVYANFAEIDG